jgi:hypothetical protein
MQRGESQLTSECGQRQDEESERGGRAKEREGEPSKGGRRSSSRPVCLIWGGTGRAGGDGASEDNEGRGL